jgi:hypothetical protein
MNNLADAIGKSGGSEFLLKALQVKEADRDSIVKNLARCSPRVQNSVDPEWLKTRIRSELGELAGLLNMDLPRAKAELCKHVSEIKMIPTFDSEQSFYVAEGEWDITGEGSTGSQLLGWKENQYFRMVAGVGFEPTTFGL